MLGSFIPEQNILVEVADEDGIVSLIQQRRLLADLFLGSFAFRDVTSDRNVLVRLTLGIKEWNYRGVDPVKAAVLGAILNLTTPDLSARYCGPKVSYEFFRMVTRVDDAMVLTKQFFAGVLGNFAELIVGKSDDAPLIGDSDDRRLV